MEGREETRKDLKWTRTRQRPASDIGKKIKKRIITLLENSEGQSFGRGRKYTQIGKNVEKHTFQDFAVNIIIKRGKDTAKFPNWGLIRSPKT